MKTSIFVSVVLSTVLWSSNSEAQGTLYVSNLSQTPTGHAQIGSDSWIAQAFWLGFSGDTRSNTLNSVQLLLNAASGSPHGFTVSIYSGGSSGPQSSLGSLSGSYNPVSGGVYTYTTSGITILPGRDYFVVVTSTTPLALGAFDWSAASSFTQSPGTGWTIDNTFYSSVNGMSWRSHVRGNVFQMAIYATPIPEPSSSLLFVLGLGGVLLCRRRGVQQSVIKK